MILVLLTAFIIDVTLLLVGQRAGGVVVGGVAWVEGNSLLNVNCGPGDP